MQIKHRHNGSYNKLTVGTIELKEGGSHKVRGV